MGLSPPVFYGINQAKDGGSMSIYLYWNAGFSDQRNSNWMLGFEVTKLTVRHVDTGRLPMVELHGETSN
jgi:hypothetical protein